MSFIGDIYNGMVTKFQDPIANNAQAIGSAIKPLIMSCFLLYVLFLVYKLYTKKDFIIEEMTNALLLFAVVGTFTYAGNYYYDYVIPFVQNSGDQIASALTGTSSSSVSAVDTVYNLFEAPLKTLRDRLEDIGITETYIGVWAELAPARFSLWLSQTIFTLFIAINLLIAKIMVTLLLSVGILFFCFAVFPATRNLFTSFTGLALNYILLNVMYSLAAKIAADVITSVAVTDTSSEGIIGGAATILISVIIITLAINQIPTLVSSLTGGVGISPFTISGSGFTKAARALGLGKGAKAIGNTVTTNVKSGANKTWNKFRGKGSASTSN
ncbi:type IV secretion system protein [Volucribacter amazonae]|uniref:Type IV secretion system protein VirB6 n=1 Tax=Volucribacter amazonae TaxID=256731 RepID=A0A9X4PFL2_9PAST|nr:type IV secretion system protein [Volucribacter amazonae]MDG6896374.1 hypothetical protein [Volucribacter amazonae]MDG6896416.1 hypothetical protein [Volucribacter amazonae]